MDNFIYNKREIEFAAVSGTVIDSSKFSETHITSSGGGGYLHEGTGSISAPSVHSRSITNHEIWLKTADGREESISLRGHDVPLRTGQLVTIISAGQKQSSANRLPSILVNHSAGKYWTLLSAQELNKKFKLELPSGMSVLYTLAVWFLAAAVLVLVFGATGDRHTPILNSLMFIVPIAYFVYRVRRKKARRSRLEGLLAAHMEALTERAAQAG